MMNTIAIDVGSEVSSVCVLSAKGRLCKEELVATKISALKGIIKKVAKPRQVVFEEGTQAAWLWSELHNVCDDVLVCDPRQNKQLSGQYKTDRNDSRNLAERAQAGLLKRVWHGGKELQSLREAVRTYQSLTEESVRMKNQLKAVFRSCGVRIGTKAYHPKSRKEACEQLRLAAQQERVMRLGAVHDAVLVERDQALKTMVKFARKNPLYKILCTADGMGPIFASMFIAEVGDPRRFRTRKQFWSYVGLAVMTYETSEFELKNGRVVRKARPVRTRGLVRAYNRTLKYVLKQAAVILSRSKWSTYYQALLARSKNANNAWLTLTRKLASVLLHITKTGEEYDIAKVFAAQKV